MSAPDLTYWNYELTPARRVIVRVSHSPRSTWWCAALEGKERRAVEVNYHGQVFFLDNENEVGWEKVTAGRGGPEYGHNGLPDDSVVVREDV